MNYRHDVAIYPGLTDLPGASWLDGLCISRVLGQRLTADVADLLDVAVGVYSADRRSPRDFSGSRTGQRSIRVELSLRNPDRWNAAHAAASLQEYLYWLSGDDWSFCFRQRCSQPSEAESQAPLFSVRPESPTYVALFSGGLDSLAGLACTAVRQPLASHVLVSGYTNTRLLAHQRRQLGRIRSEFERQRRSGSSSIWHVAVGFGISQSIRRIEEKSQRTRAFVFSALGVAAAVQAEADTLHVYENGMGALNLPLNETQLGVDNYRGVHPRSLMLLESLLALVLDNPVCIENPYLFRTKAEMCRALPAAGLVDVIPETVSCDSFPLRMSGQPAQCGHCTSCVLRRQALHAAGLSVHDPGNAYWRDVLNGESSLRPAQRHDMLVMGDQVFKLGRYLDQDDPWSVLTESYPELDRTSREFSIRNRVELTHARSQFLRLLRTYVSECQCFAPLAPR